MRQPDDKVKVIGRRIELSEGLSVSVGKSDPPDGETYVAFVNTAGDSNKFILSEEAAQALTQLLLKRDCPDLEWQVVRSSS